MQKRLIAMLIAVLICTSFLCGCDMLTSSNLSQSENSSQSETDTKVYTIDEFCKKFDDEKGFANKHSNEFFMITGEIEKDSDVLFGNIDFESGFESTEWKTEYRVTCKFENRDDVNDLGAGDVVTLKGKLFSFATSGIVLQDCTLISVDKKNDNDSSTEPTTEATTEAITESTTEAITEIITEAATEVQTQTTVTTTTPPQTQPPATAATTAEPESEITLVSFNSSLRRNEDASITIKGKPNTEYSIKVYYSTGASKADGLENKTSNADGLVTWSWHVGGNTSTEGIKKLTISGDGQTFDTTFTVSE